MLILANIPPADIRRQGNSRMESVCAAVDLAGAHVRHNLKGAPVVALCYLLTVNRTLRKLFCVIACFGTAIAFAGDGKEWLAAVSTDQRDEFAKRLDGYLKANHRREWSKLFDFISDAGKVASIGRSSSPR
jgi:hypothetical protein